MDTYQLITVLGPTASGKTTFAAALAARLNTEIISADSMQVYRHMDIGSAKIRPEEMDGIRHYLVDELLPDEEFHVARFVAMAKEAMAEIYERGHIPIAVGGTGFYIQALLYDIDFEDTCEDTAYRTQLEDKTKELGNEWLLEQVRSVDPASAEAIHANNTKRLIRALEYFKLTGRPISEHNEKQRQKESPYNFCYFVLNRDRAELYRRIDLRVDQMMEQGLLKEVEALKAMGYDRSYVSMQGLGYKELLSYLDGECTLDDAVSQIKQSTRHFAKRQLTWFRRERDVTWLDIDGAKNEDVISILTEQCVKNLHAAVKIQQK